MNVGSQMGPRSAQSQSQHSPSIVTAQAQHNAVRHAPQIAGGRPSASDEYVHTVEPLARRARRGWWGVAQHIAKRRVRRGVALRNAGQMVAKTMSKLPHGFKVVEKMRPAVEGIPRPEQKPAFPAVQECAHCGEVEVKRGPKDGTPTPQKEVEIKYKYK